MTWAVPCWQLSASALTTAPERSIAASVFWTIGSSHLPLRPSLFDAGETATTSPLSASTTETSPGTSFRNLPSTARCRGSSPACAVIHFERRAA